MDLDENNHSVYKIYVRYYEPEKGFLFEGSGASIAMYRYRQINNGGDPVNLILMSKYSIGKI